MSHKRKREYQGKKGPASKKQKTDANNEERIIELFVKINGFYGGKTFPAVADEKIDEWEEQIKEKIEEKPERFKLPNDLRAYWKCIGLKPDFNNPDATVSIEDQFTTDEWNKYEDEVQLDISMYYSTFLKSGAECVENYDAYEWPDEDGEEVEVAITPYWMEFASDGEFAQIIINCDSSDKKLFGQVYLVINNCGTCQFMCKSVTSMLESLWNYVRDVQNFELMNGGSEGNFSNAMTADKGSLDNGKLGDLNTKDEANKDIVAQYKSDNAFIKEIDIDKRTIIFDLSDGKTKVATFTKSFDNQNDLFLVKNKYSGFAYRCGVEELANGLKSGEIRGPHIHLAKSFADQLT